jgi:16S rRNA (guanine527-N7)-methyltransferase
LTASGDGVTRGKKIKDSEAGTDFHALLKAGCERLGLELGNDVVERLFVYFEELKRWSRKINLIARETREEDIIESHFLDSLTLLPLLDGHVHLLDVGTGAGFPGLVCKAARPELTLTLVEPRLKRVSFLRHIVRTLDLDGVFIFDCRIENEALIPSDTPFTHITGRAVTDIGTFLGLVRRFALSEPIIICMKGPKWQEELTAVAGEIQAGSLDLVRTVQMQLPFSGAQRTLLALKVLVKAA